MTHDIFNKLDKRFSKLKDLLCIWSFSKITGKNQFYSNYILNLQSSKAIFNVDSIYTE